MVSIANPVVNTIEVVTSDTLYISTNNGTSWTTKSLPFSGVNYIISGNAYNPVYIFASTGSTLHRSANYGDTWTEWTFPSGAGTLMSFSPSCNPDGNIGLMAVFTGKTIVQWSGYATTPSWANYGNTLPTGVISSSLATNTGRGLATTGTGIYYTTGNATPWIQGTMPSVDNLVGIWQNGDNASFYAITNTTLYRSTNQTASWSVLKTL